MTGRIDVPRHPGIHRLTRLLQQAWPLAALILVIPFTAPSAATDWAANRLISLDKVTVGPADNFEATIAPDGSLLYFTQARNQIPHVYRQGTDSALAEPLLGGEIDTKDPALQPNGKHLAVTSLRYDARGDICLVALHDTARLQCLTEPGAYEREPFWLDNTRLGYLQRASADAPWQLVVRNIAAGTTEVLHEGRLSAPSAAPGGRLIAFNEIMAGTERPRLRFYQPATQRLLTPPRFDLPGLTGFTAFATDGETLYFSHYLNDTSLDQRIDGSDHSVIFRIAVDTLLDAEQPPLPEQLTSVAQNCNFPQLTQAHLYLTCAFEGSLDIYRLPRSGAVPADWNRDKLWHAHRVARSHEDRLLLLNTLRFRGQADSRAMLERMLSHHLEIGEYSAGRYYVGQLRDHYRQHGQAELAAFYSLLEGLLDIRAAQLELPEGVVTAALRERLAAQRATIAASAAPARWRALMQAYLDFAGNQPARIDTRLSRADLANEQLPMARYLHFELYRLWLHKTDPERLLALYPLMYDAAVLSHQARLHYAVDYLRLLARQTPQPDSRRAALNTALARLEHSKIRALFQAELNALAVADDRDEAAQNQATSALLEQLKAHRDAILLRNAMHIRAIQILGRAEQFAKMELLSRHWLLTTSIREMAFPHVAEQYSLITLDKAYGMWAEGESLRAFNTFYSAIRQTNDLEAVYQLVRLGLAPRQDLQARLERAITQLEREQLLGQNRAYVNALRLLLTTDAATAEDNLSEAIDLLQGMTVKGLNPAVKDLLLGYAYHRQLARQQQRYRYDKALFQKAHRHYMLALDLGFDNGRIKAAVWENLARLHFRVHNHALAADFYRERTRLPFLDNADEARVRLAYARALFYVDASEAAWQQAQTALQLATATDSLARGYFLDRAALYALSAQHYQEAIALYDRLLATAEPLSPANRAKAHLARGYCHLELGQTDQATADLEQARALNGQLELMPASTERLVAFSPQRQQLIALGLLAQASGAPLEQAKLRQQRMQILQAMDNRQLEALAIENADRLAWLAKDAQQRALALEQAGQPKPAGEAMQAGLDAALDWVKATDNPAGPVIYHSLANYLSFAISHPQLELRHRRLDQALKATRKALTDGPLVAPISRYRDLTLALLWDRYRGDEQTHLTTPSAQTLAEEAPDLYAELKALAKGLTQSPDSAQAQP